jgi:FkbH-like protein
MYNLKYSEILKENLLLATDAKDKNPYSIKVLSNIVCNQLEDILSYNLRKSEMNPIINMGNYDNIIQDSYQCINANMVVIHYDLVNIIDKYPDFIESFTKEQFSALFNTVKLDIDLILENLKLVPIVVFNSFCSLAIYQNVLKESIIEQLAFELNYYLDSKKATNLQVININSIVSKIGITNAFDYRMFLLSKTLYSISFWKEYVYSLSSLVYRYTGLLKKAIIFDCDNTLWKGILGEDGMEGIDMSLQSKTGQMYNKVQQIAKWLSQQGVIIGLCSKNNPGDVEVVFNEHPDIKLTKENIVISKVNWDDKATNLREIAKELNIGLNSLIFVDDSSFEINLIREQIPEILTLQVPSAIYDYPNQLLKLVNRYFYLSGNSEDIAKTKQYKEQSLRTEEKDNHQSLEDYLSSIEIEISITENDSSQISRISQITQKTNQFNLTTKRYTENQIKLFMENDSDRIFSILVKDKFGESGLTAIIIVNENIKTVNIDSFVMSCRIMGRNIEKAIMNFLVNKYTQNNIEEITASFSPTIKNRPVVNFYEGSNYKLEKEENGNKLYRLLVSEYVPHEIDYIKILS